MTTVNFPVHEFWQPSVWKLWDWNFSVLIAVDLTAVKTPVLESWQLSSWILFSGSYYFTDVWLLQLYKISNLIFVISCSYPDWYIHEPLSARNSDIQVLFTLSSLIKKQTFHVALKNAGKTVYKCAISDNHFAWNSSSDSDCMHSVYIQYSYDNGK